MSLSVPLPVIKCLRTDPLMHMQDFGRRSCSVTGPAEQTTRY